MSLVEQLHAAHKARLARLSPEPKKLSWHPVIHPKKEIKPHPLEAGWESMWFHDLVFGHSKEPRTIRIRDIQEAICKHYKISVLDLLSCRRAQAISFPRQIAMYLCRHLTAHSYAEIGRRFGGRDHTTVIHALQKIDGLYGYDVRVTCDVNSIKKVLA